MMNRRGFARKQMDDKRSELEPDFAVQNRISMVFGLPPTRERRVTGTRESERLKIRDVRVAAVQKVDA
jgi:hypothetical protein